MGIIPYVRTLYWFREKYKYLSYSEFISKKDNKSYKITHASQTLKLNLDNAGARVKSEAVLEGKESAIQRRPVETNIKHFVFKKTFYLFIIEKDSPIVALRVNDIKEFME